ncbi:MAG: DUF2135 domain-containing protein [Planctomycetes bacterium]|nr:DUF2135 domain-containing protein [Planctomycetota bacterium]
MKRPAILPVFVLLFLATLSPVSGQTVPPALMVKEEEKSVPLHLAGLNVDVRIFGHVAQTSTTMTFSNPNDRVLEGDLYFPLPEGATVSGYALDIEGKMVDGVAVEKHKGRQVFEAIVRQGIDPGLIEWTKGNNFKTRVFPIPARGSRTIRVDYVTELTGPADRPAYHLPLKFKNKVDDFSLRVEVVKPLAAPQITQGELANFSFAQWRDSYVAEAKLEDIAPAKDLIIALPNVQKQTVVVERADDGQVYFAVYDYPEVPTRPSAVAPPKRIAIHWDASGSRIGGDRDRELKLLEAYFDAWANPVSGGGPTIEVDLFLLRNTQSKPERFVLKQSNPAKLIARLKNVQYDGGTQIGSLTPPPNAPAPDFHMLFTDGISNFGREKPSRLEAPVYIFSADAAANHAFLHSLAMVTGGRYFNLKRLTDADVLSGIGRSAFSFLKADAGQNEATELFPKSAQPVAGRFALVGKLNGPHATVTLRYGMKKGVSQTRTYPISRDTAAEGSLLRRLWAQKKLAELMIFQKRNEKPIVALGQEHGLVTPFTSLIVLDSLEQYLEHEIAPPGSLPEMRQEYMRQMDTLERQKKKEQTEKLDVVAAMWQERVKWWSKEYKYPKKFKYREPGEERPGLLQRIGGALGGGLRMGAPSEGAAEPGRSNDAAPAMRPESPEALAPQDGDAFGGEGQAGENADKEEDEGRSGAGRQPAISIKPWDPKTPYVKALRAAAPGDRIDVYMKNRAEFGTSPAFFLDCADFFAGADNRAMALRVLSNVAELELENPTLLRVLAHRLDQIGELDLAILTFEEVRRLRPEEPQSHRDLALVLARRAASGSAESIGDDYTRALALLAEVVMGRWDGRFPEIELMALEEFNSILPRAKKAGVKKVPLDERLVKLLDVDVRIVMTWHADNTDIDLWVIEPSGEKAYYEHNRTTIGGLVSADYTGGYGPEEYMVRRAMSGVYKVQANFYGSGAVKLLGAVTVQVDVFTNFGRANEARKSLTVRLQKEEETIDIGQIEF